MKSYLEITISSPEPQRELLIPTMIELGCQGFLETDSSLVCYLEQHRWDETKREALKAELTKILQTVSANAAVSFREFTDQNWNAQWEGSLQPIEIGHRLVVKPSWSNYEQRQNKIILEIDPKMSFGTGYHETTRLMLTLLEKNIRRGMRVLDAGTGTGILAIASIKLGASCATAIDNDEWSIANAGENALRNNVSSQVTISTMSIAQFNPSSFELVCANLTLNTNLEYLAEFKRVLAPGGLLLLSGLLFQDRDQMRQGLTDSQFVVIEEEVEHEWIALAAKATA